MLKFLRKLFRFLKKVIMFVIKTFIILGLIGVATLLIARAVTAIHSWGRIHSLENAPQARVAIVFGAGLWRDGSPTPVLRDRVKTAADLYFQNKIEKILFYRAGFFL